MALKKLKQISNYDKSLMAHLYLAQTIKIKDWNKRLK